MRRTQPIPQMTEKEGVVNGAAGGSAREQTFVGILVHGDALAECHARLVAALRSHPKVSKLWVGLLPARQHGLNAMLQRLSSALDATLARQPRGVLPVADLNLPGVDLQFVTRASLQVQMQALELDWLIDLTGTQPPHEWVHACRHGTLQVCCNDRADDLNFRNASLRKTCPERLALLHWTANQSEPRMPFNCLHAPSGGHLGYDRSLLAGRAVSFLCRVLDGTSDAAGPATPAPTRPLAARPPASQLLRSFDAALQAVADRVRWRWSAPDQWFIAINTAPGSFLTRGHALQAGTWKPVANDGNRFYADPMLLEHQGRVHVFFEDYPYKLKRGVIAHAMLDDSGQLTPPQMVLERPYHLSYPFVFKHDGAIYMVPETSANQTVELYRAAEFPQQWILVKTLLKGVNAVDATLHNDGTRWWMFVNIGEHGSSTNDELHLYHADDPLGPWQPHRANPVRAGLVGSRPAGPLFDDGHRWIRPAQDCSRLYGGGLVFNAIDQLDLEAYVEHSVRHLPPSEMPGCDGLHTVSSAAGLEIIDARRAGT